MEITRMNTNPRNSSLKIMLIIIAIFALIFLSAPANAETGTITVSKQTTPAGYVFTGASAGTPDFTHIYFDTSHYNTITEIFIQLPAGINFTTPGRSTTCTITGGGSGTCSVGYNNISGTIIFYFSNPSIITSNPFTVSYSENIFTDMFCSASCGINFAKSAASGIGSTKPVGIGDATPGNVFYGGTGPGSTNTYTVIVGSTVSNSYNITYGYSGIQLFTTSINKSGTNIVTKVLIQNASGVPINYPVQGDASFNNISYNATNVYGSGISLNMSISSGEFTAVVVNSTGSTIPPSPTPTPTPPPVPSNSTTGVAMSWDKSSYNIGEVGTLSVNVTGQVTPPLFGDFRVIIVNSTGQQAFYVWDSSGTYPQTGSFLFSFPSADTYTAKFISHSPFTGDNTLVELSVQAVSPVSYIFAPSTVVTGSNISISYKFNPAPITGAIEDVQTDSWGIGFPGIYFNIDLCPCDTSLHSLNYTINGVGKHTLRLWDTTNIKVVASTIVDVTSIGAPPPQNITYNYLALDGAQYSVGDVINGLYQISNTNWSSYGYFKASLISSGRIGMGSVTLTQQSGTFQIPVTGGAFGIFQSGPANVTILAGSNVLSASNEMASAPVTILSDHGAYSISASPVNICKSQTETVKFTGLGGAGILQELYMTPAGTSKLNNYSFNQNGTRKFVYNDGTVKNNGGIIYSILDTNGNFQVNTIVKYKSTDCTDPEITPPPGATLPPGATPPQTGTGQASALVTLITSNIFWALIITVGLMIAIAWRTKDGFPTGTIGVLVSGIFTFIGWLPAWIFFTMFVIGALFIASSIVEKQMRNVTP
jgi:hypothetical protein